MDSERHAIRRARDQKWKGNRSLLSLNGHQISVHLTCIKRDQKGKGPDHYSAQTKGNRGGSNGQPDGLPGEAKGNRLAAVPYKG